MLDNVKNIVAKIEKSFLDKEFNDLKSVKDEYNHIYKSFMGPEWNTTERCVNDLVITALSVAQWSIIQRYKNK